MARYSQFRIIVRAPDDPAFELQSGWWAFRHLICKDGTTLFQSATDSAIDEWKRPSMAARCQRFLVSHAERRIQGDEDLLKEILLQRLDLWLPHPPGRRLPELLRLSLMADSDGQQEGRRRREGVWRRDPKSCSSTGSHYNFARDKAPELFRNDESGYELIRDGDGDGFEGWTSPLVLELRLESSSPNLDSDKARIFWEAVLNSGNILDIEPLAPREEEADVRSQFFRLAAERSIRSGLRPESRSALQALVFGGGDAPAPHWFLILDSLGGDSLDTESRRGQFRLEDFLSGRPKWSWIPPKNELGFWADWLAKVACERVGIDRLEPAPHPPRVPPTPFREIRWKNLGERNSENSPASAPLLRQESESSWREALTGLTNSGGRAADGGSDVGPEIATRRLVRDQLLPDSAVLVQLPVWPIKPRPAPSEETRELKTDWENMVNGLGWLDLDSSALWPEAWWPRGLWWDGRSSEPSAPWSIRGDAWHDLFYKALHERSAACVAKWGLELYFVLNESILDGDCVLGEAGPAGRVKPFVIA